MNILQNFGAGEAVIIVAAGFCVSTKTPRVIMNLTVSCWRLQGKLVRVVNVNGSYQHGGGLGSERFARFLAKVVKTQAARRSDVVGLIVMLRNG